MGRRLRTSGTPIPGGARRFKRDAAGLAQWMREALDSADTHLANAPAFVNRQALVASRASRRKQKIDELADHATRGRVQRLDGSGYELYQKN
jgi:hypothetical protein